jgi:hypothetical protein
MCVRHLQSVREREVSLTSAPCVLRYRKAARQGEEAKENRCGGESETFAQHVP